MKKILLVVAFVATALSYGQTEKGKWMIGSNVGLSFSSQMKTTKQGGASQKSTTTTFIFNPDASYFIANNFALGVGLDYTYTGVKDATSTSSFGIMPNLKYFFNGTKVKPYVGVGVGYRLDATHPKKGDSYTEGGLAARVEGGIAYFLTPSLAATAGIKYDYTSITHSDNSDLQTQTGLINVGIGVAYFF